MQHQKVYGVLGGKFSHFDMIERCDMTSLSPWIVVSPILLVYYISLTFRRCLTHWGRVTHICVSELTIIGSDNGLSPGRRQAIIWNNAGLLLIEPLGTNFREISIGIQTFSFKKMHLNMSSAKWRPFCHGLNVLMWHIQSILSQLPLSSPGLQYFLQHND